MMAQQLFGALLCLFPFSFFAYLFSERLIYTHQSRVGIHQTFSGFVMQGWINVKDLFQKGTDLGTVFSVAIQFSFVALLPFFNPNPESQPLQGGFLLCLVLNMVALMAKSFASSFSSDPGNEIQNRMTMDQKTLQVAIGSLLALICALSSFSIGGSWSLSELLVLQRSSLFNWGIFWSPVQLIFFILFQISGMLIFEEHPFEQAERDSELGHILVGSQWVKSARFFVWSLVGAQIFLGGESFFGESGSVFCFVFFQLKGAAIYVIFRLLSLYFPKHSQAETLKLTLLFLIPISLAALVFVLMFHGVFNLGGPGV